MMNELDQYKWLCREMETKLIELMGESSYNEWSKHIARSLFFNEMESLPDNDFKRVTMNHLSEIFKEVIS